MRWVLKVVRAEDWMMLVNIIGMVAVLTIQSKGGSGYREGTRTDGQTADQQNAVLVWSAAGITEVYFLARYATLKCKQMMLFSSSQRGSSDVLCDADANDSGEDDDSLML